MKKNLLTLLVVLASFSFAIGQDITVSEPFIAGYQGFDWSGRHWQQGAEVQWDAVYDTAGADSVELKVMILDIDSDWVTIHDTVFKSDGANGEAVDGIVDDRTYIPATFPLPSELHDSINPIYLLQVRGNYNPVLEADAWSNGAVNIVEAYGDSIRVANDTLYPEGVTLTRGFKYNFHGNYGITGANYLEISLRHMDAGWGELDAVNLYPYSSTAGDANTGLYDQDLSIPLDFAETIAEDDILGIRVTLASTGSPDPVWFWYTLEDATMEIDTSELELNLGDKDTLNAAIMGSGPGYPTNDTITWTTSDEFVVTVENGALVGVGEGTATITATAALNGATATCEVTVTEDTPGTYTTTTQLQNVELYPNPVTSELTIEGLTNGTYTVEVFNLLGAKQKEVILEGTATVNFSELPVGTYLVKVHSDKGTFVQKINKL